MIRVKPTKKTQENLKAINSEKEYHDWAINHGFRHVGKLVGARVKKLIKDPPKTGRIYYFRGSTHQASAPGEPPANMTGKLMKSYDYDVSGSGQLEVGETAEYAGFLEEGTARMAPRPHLIRAINETATDAVNILKQEYTVRRKR